MKRRVWIKIVSCLLLVSLLAGGETVLYVGAEAEACARWLAGMLGT